MAAEEEQLGHSKKMSAGTVASVVTGPTNAGLVVVVAEEADRGTEEVDLRK